MKINSSFRKISSSSNSSFLPRIFASSSSQLRLFSSSGSSSAKTSSSQPCLQLQLSNLAFFINSTVPAGCRKG